jgi:hypothetical protein
VEPPLKGRVISLIVQVVVEAFAVEQTVETLGILENQLFCQ